MPQYNRSNTTYRKLPEQLATSKLPDAKLTASLNVLVPKEIDRKKVDRFMKEAHKSLADAFETFIKKEVKKSVGSDKEK